jgi:hypothetical protein
VNTIEEDSDFIKFLEKLGKPSDDALPTCEAILEEIEKRDKENETRDNIITPLLQFMRTKKDEQRFNREVIPLKLLYTFFF